MASIVKGKRKKKAHPFAASIGPFKVSMKPLKIGRERKGR
jgi:hypothetical protein